MSIRHLFDVTRDEQFILKWALEGLTEQILDISDCHQFLKFGFFLELLDNTITLQIVVTVIFIDPQKVDELFDCGCQTGSDGVPYFY